jgi:predicted porin
MQTDTTARAPHALLAPGQGPRPGLNRLRVIAAATLLALGGASHAIDYGPFTLTGFAKAETVRTSNTCPDCQVVKDAGKQYSWADPVGAGQHYGAGSSNVTLFEPWLGAKFDLGKGFKLSGLLSQRWRDGKEDIPGFWYEKNVALSHEDWGSLRVGAMTTRAWSLADYPYGTNIGVADVWASSGAGYGLMTKAARYTSRILDVAEGDLVLEATYDQGNTGFKIHKPRFFELYAQFHKGDLVIDAALQDARNGNPQAWSHGPFSGLTPFPVDDAKLGPSGQSIAMVMGRYTIDSRIEVSGGLRRNRWSGAHAVITTAGPPSDQWNNPFNVDWGGALDFPQPDGSTLRVSNPGYAAVSVDLMAGLRYKRGPWTAHTGLTYLGQASTKNPSDRGQHNSALVNTVGLSYTLAEGLQVYGLAGMVQYGRKGLSPMSMPGNAAFTNVDSRVSTHGNWFGAGAVYVF